MPCIKEFSPKVKLCVGAFACLGLLAPPGQVLHACELLFAIGIPIGISYEVAIGRRPFWKAELVEFLRAVTFRIVLHMTIIVPAILLCARLLR